MATVELDGVSKTYDSQRAVVQDVTLRIEDGEFMVLLGPSGCGKSTTLRMIAGLEPISDGSIRIDGRLMNRVPARDRDIAMVFQSYALYPHMSVFDNMAFGLRRRGLSKPDIARKVHAAAEGLELSALLGRRPFALSGGQRQRVALGRAIVRDPKVFLLDEPLSNLDAALRATTRSELVKLHQRLGATMIYVTHDQVEAMTMGTRICIMSAGRIVQIGKPLEVYRDPINTFVARFLGSPAMNLLPAEIADGHLLVGGQIVPLPAVYRGSAPAGAVVLGIRPEDIVPGPAEQNAPQARIVTAAALGAETHLAVALPNISTAIVIRAASDATCLPGQTVSLDINVSAIRLFDAASEERVPACLQA